MKRQLILMISLLLLAACSERPAFGREAGTPPATPAPGGNERTVTLADDSQTITLHVGESFLLKLGEGYDWTITPSDQTIVSRVVNIMVVRGAQGVYVAHKAGRTKLSATGDPACRKAQPACGAPSREFHVQIVVQ